MLITTLFAAALAVAVPNDVLVVVNKDASTVSIIAVESGTALATLPPAPARMRPRLRPTFPFSKLQAP